MILNLSIKNFAIIEDLDINFKNGMNILLGETGAGKSIIIDALGLLMGNRSDFDKIRNGETKAFVEGTFEIENEDLIKSINEKYSLIEEDHLLVVSRTLENNKSVCRINYHVIPQSILKDIMENIIDIHSQHKNNSFFDSRQQLSYLDLYSNKNTKLKSLEFTHALKEYQEEYYKLCEAKKIYQEMKEKQNSFDDADYLNFQINEIEKVNPKENEIEEIEDQLARLNSFEKIMQRFQSFDENYQLANDHLYQAKKELSLINDEKFESLAEKFESLYYEIDDTYNSIKEEFSSFEEAKSQIEYLNSRRLELSPLRRKYGRSSKEILEYLKNAKETINFISNIEENLKDQENLINSLTDKCNTLAKVLNQKRIKSKEHLENDMNDIFKSLGLNNATFKVDVSLTSLNEFGSNQIDFLLQANLGSKFLPLSQTASIGETSRINLAYKLVFNQLNPVGTIIFDEIDTGISSHIGVLVSKKIKELSLSSQVIVITHLPQMASIGDHIYFVSKYNDNQTTKTKIEELNQEQVIREIALMISGNEVDESSLIAAKRMIESMHN